MKCFTDQLQLKLIDLFDVAGLLVLKTPQLVLKLLDELFPLSRFQEPRDEILQPEVLNPWK